MTEQPIIVRVPVGDEVKMIGRLWPQSNIYYKEVSGSKHFFRKTDAIGIDAEYFETLLPNNTEIQVHDRETGTTYAVLAETVKEHGRFYHFKNEKDYRTQIFLPRSYWKIL